MDTLDLVTTLIHNPLTVTLAGLGVVCMVIAIIGKIGDLVDLSPLRAVVLATFGFFLVVVAVGLAYMVETSPEKELAIITPTESWGKFDVPPTHISQPAIPPSATSKISEGITPSLCPATISQSKIDLWRQGEGNAPVEIVQQYIDAFDRLRSNTGIYTATQSIPGGVVLDTDFDKTDANRWRELPVTPIVHSGSWGLWQTTGEFEAPNDGACMTLIP